MKSLEKFVFESENEARNGSQEGGSPGLPNQPLQMEVDGSEVEIERGRRRSPGSPKTRKDSNLSPEIDSAKVYKMDPISDAIIDLCEHDRIALDDVLEGKVKAVNRLEAEKMLEFYGIGISLQNWIRVVRPGYEDAWDPCENKYGRSGFKLRTGLDICTDCVKFVSDCELAGLE